MEVTRIDSPFCPDQFECSQLRVFLQVKGPDESVNRMLSKTLLPTQKPNPEDPAQLLFIDVSEPI